MNISTVGVVLLVLVVVFILSRIWFHFVEAILRFFKQLLGKKPEPPAWHALPNDEDSAVIEEDLHSEDIAK